MILNRAMKCNKEKKNERVLLLLTIARNELSLKIVEEMLKRDPVTATSLSKALNVPREKVRYNLERLVRDGVLKKQKGDGRRVYD